MRCEKVKALSGPRVKPRLNFADLSGRDDIQVGAFGQEPADEAVGVFDGGFFPGMAGIAEEGLGAEEGIKLTMEDVFDAIIVGDGLEQRLRDRREDLAEGEIGSLGGFILDFEDASEARFAFDGDLKSGFASTDQVIDFPMAGFQSQVGGLRSVSDGDSTEDQGFGAVDSLEAADGVFAREERDQAASFRVDPLIDGLLADDGFAVFSIEAAGDDFRGPPHADTAFDLAAEF